MSQMTISEVLRNRSCWHTMATLPPRNQTRTKVQSTPSRSDRRNKAARDAIYELQEQRRIEAEFTL